MEWTESLRSALIYAEEHLLEPVSEITMAKKAHISPLYLQQGFKIMTGYSIKEYVKCRRLYLAALDIISGEEKVIDLAYKYGYETPESFSKAFRRFHGVSPAHLKGKKGTIRTFLPLKITISIQGGEEMDYTVEKMDGFKVIGFETVCKADDSFSELPKFWDKFRMGHVNPLKRAGYPRNAIEKVICESGVGEFGICIDYEEEGKCRYLIAGRYRGHEVPEGMVVYELPATTWVKFRCVGPMPGAIQAMNRRIYKEWLPGNPDYELTMGEIVEWYSKGDTRDSDYESAIWLPVMPKNKKPVPKMK